MWVFIRLQKIVDAFESNGKHVKEYDSMLDYLVSILYDFYDESNDEPIKMNEEGPTVILMVGVNGSGKTTTSAKLIQYYKEQGKKVAVLCDRHIPSLEPLIKLILGQHV